MANCATMKNIIACCYLLLLCFELPSVKLKYNSRWLKASQNSFIFRNVFHTIFFDFTTSLITQCKKKQTKPVIAKKVIPYSLNLTASNRSVKQNFWASLLFIYGYYLYHITTLNYPFPYLDLNRKKASSLQYLNSWECQHSGKRFCFNRSNVCRGQNHLMLLFGCRIINLTYF